MRIFGLVGVSALLCAILLVAAGDSSTKAPTLTLASSSPSPASIPPRKFTFPLSGPPFPLVVPPILVGNITSVDPFEAYQYLHDNPDAVFIDQKVEHYYVGYPMGSEHIAWTEYPLDKPTPESSQSFADAVLQRVKGDLSTKLVLICRSGKRTLEAGAVLLKAGFKTVVHVDEGFEGDLDDNKHRSTLNGWRFRGLPWEQE